MPPASSQKGTGKKGAGAIARQRSRNTTPSTSTGSVPLQASLPPVENKQTEFLDLNYEAFRNVTYEDLVDQNASGSHMPESKSLDGIMTRFQRLQDTLEKRSTFCDRGMRLLVSALRSRQDEAAAERSREEERQRAEDDERARKASKANKANKKKRKAADTLAPPDGNTGQSDITNLFQLHLVSSSTEAANCTSGKTVLPAPPSIYRVLLCVVIALSFYRWSQSCKIKLDSTNLRLTIRRTFVSLTRLQQTEKSFTRQRLHLIFSFTCRSCYPWRHGRRRKGQGQGQSQRRR